MLTSRRTLLAATPGAIATALASPSSAAPRWSIERRVTSFRVSAIGAPRGSQLLVTWRNAAGYRTTIHTPTTFESGELPYFSSARAILLSPAGRAVAVSPLIQPRFGNPVPAPARRAGFTRLALNSTFNTLNRIDMSMSGRPGYDWYPRFAWPSADQPQQNPRTTLSLRTEGAMRYLRLAPSVSNCNWTLSTMDPKTLAGRGFRFGYFGARIRFTQVPYSNDWSRAASWASFWLTSRNAYAGADGTRFAELDVFEQIAGPNNWAGGLHEWRRNTATGHSWCDERLYGCPLSGWHTVSATHQPGVVTWFVDGAQVARRTYGPNIAPRVGGSTFATLRDGNPQVLPAGTFDVLSHELMTLIIGTGATAPMDVSNIQVWV